MIEQFISGNLHSDKVANEWSHTIVNTNKNKNNKKVQFQSQGKWIQWTNKSQVKSVGNKRLSDYTQTETSRTFY